MEITGYDISNFIRIGKSQNDIAECLDKFSFIQDNISIEYIFNQLEEFVKKLKKIL